MYLLLTAALIGQAQPFQIAAGFDVRPAPPTHRQVMAGKPLGDVWPEGVPYIPGIVEYRRTQHTQKIVIQDERDSNVPWPLTADVNFANSAPDVNPNRTFPWHGPGGLPDGLSNRTGIYMPPGTDIQVQTFYVPIPLAGRPLPKRFWTYPQGTLLADVLLDKRGQAFEVRMREKQSDGWHNFRYAPQPVGMAYTTETWTRQVSDPRSVALLGTTQVSYKVRRVPALSRVFDRASLTTTYVDDGTVVPRGYLGAGLNCNQCHQHSGSANYGIALRGGGDGDFSFSPFREGTHVVKRGVQE